MIENIKGGPGETLDTPETLNIETWVRRNDMPISTSYNSVAHYNDKLYHFGGALGYNTSVYEFNPLDDTYTQKQNAPINLYGSNAISYEDCIFVSTSSGLYAYYPDEDRWEKKATPISLNNIASCCMLLYDDEIYTFGCESQSSVAQKYNIEKNNWTKLKSMPYSTGYNDGGVIGDKLYIIGGEWSCSNKYLVYDPATDTYEQYSTPNSMYYHECVTIDDKIYVIGGYNDRNQFYSFDGTVWTQLNNLPIGIDMFAATNIDGVIYTFGGSNGYGSRVYSYDTGWMPELNTTTYYLYEIENELYKDVGGSLVKLEGLELNETTMINHGTHHYNADILSSEKHIKLHIYEQDPSVVGYQFNYTLLYKGQTIVQDYDFDATNVAKLTFTATVNADDKLNVLLSNDSGQTWYSVKEGVKVETQLSDISTDGMTHITANALSSSQLTDIVDGTGKLRVAIYMKQAKSNANMCLDHIRLAYIANA